MFVYLLKFTCHLTCTMTADVLNLTCLIMCIGIAYVLKLAGLSYNVYPVPLTRVKIYRHRSIFFALDLSQALSPIHNGATVSKHHFI